MPVTGFVCFWPHRVSWRLVPGWLMGAATHTNTLKFSLWCCHGTKPKHVWLVGLNVRLKGQKQVSLSESVSVLSHLLHHVMTMTVTSSRVWRGHGGSSFGFRNWLNGTAASLSLPSLAWPPTASKLNRKLPWSCSRTCEDTLNRGIKQNYSTINQSQASVRLSANFSFIQRQSTAAVASRCFIL